jgi:hypothetical protein
MPKGKKKPSPPAVKRVYRSAPRTRPLPTMDDERIEELTNLALSYVNALEEKKEAAAEEGERKELLVEAMKKHGVKTYRDSESGLFVQIEDGAAKVKVLTGQPTPRNIEADRPIGENTMETAPAAESPK